MKGLLFAMGLAFAGCACSDPGLGETCNDDDDLHCEDGLECVPLAIGCLQDCEGTCEEPCSSNADCGSGQFCTASRGTQFCVDREFSPN